MYSSKINHYKNVCPRNCYSACTMHAYVKNARLVQLTGDSSHPFSEGKLCAKGFASIKGIYHRNRLKYPYYQKIRGSGNFQKITWEKAYEILLEEMGRLYDRDNNFSSLAFHQSTGNTGILRYISEEFFRKIGATQIATGARSLVGVEAALRDNDFLDITMDPDEIFDASLIMIWGANPAATNVHLASRLLEAQARGTKVVVIDPVYTQTAKIADAYVQITPSTDGALANAMTKRLVEMNGVDMNALETNAMDYHPFISSIKNIDVEKHLHICDISKETLTYLMDEIISANAILHVVGVGLQKHRNGGQNVRTIQAFAAMRGDLWRLGGGIFFPQRLLQQPLKMALLPSEKEGSATLSWGEFVDAESSATTGKNIDFLWITSANPIVQNPNIVRRRLEKINFIVTVDNYLTSTAMMSNLILPATAHFEQMDVVFSNWGIALNEQAIAPFYESRSEWQIITEFAEKIKGRWPHVANIPDYTSETEFLNKFLQRSRLRDIYGIDTIAELKQNIIKRNLWNECIPDSDVKLKYRFFSNIQGGEESNPMPLFVEGESPRKEYPFWLLSPHSPDAFNSQYWNLHIGGKFEPFVCMNKDVAKAFGLYDGEMIQLYNDEGAIQMKVRFDEGISGDTLLVFQGWTDQDIQNVNQLVSLKYTDVHGKCFRNNGIAYYDTFVNIRRSDS